MWVTTQPAAPLYKMEFFILYVPTKASAALGCKGYYTTDVLYVLENIDCTVQTELL